MTQQPTSAVHDAALPASAGDIRPAAGFGLRTADRAVWLLVAASPIVFGALTWRLGPSVLQDVVRRFSVPIAVTELLVILFALRGGFGLREPFTRAPAWTKVALAILGVVAFGTALTATADPFSAKVRTLTSVLHVLFALSLIHLLSGRWRPLRAAVWPSIVLGTLGFMVLVAAMVATIEDPQAFDWLRFHLGVTNVRQLGFYSVIGAAAALGLALTAPGERTRWGWIGATGVLLALSFWSGTRSSLAAFGATSVFAALAFPGLRSVAAARTWALAVLLGLCLSFLHQVRHPAYGAFRIWASSEGDNPDTGRLEVWLGTLRVIPQSPWIGFGESQFRSLVPEAGGVFNHPHNWLLQIVFQWGVIGAACYFALAAFVLHRFYRSTRAIGSAALPAFLVATSLLVYALYEGTLYHPYPISMLLVAIAWVVTGDTRSGGLDGRDSGRFPKAAVEQAEEAPPGR